MHLYTFFKKLEGEILRHKWLESEKVNRDIGFESALIDWMKNHRKSWIKANKNPVDKSDRHDIL